MPRLRVDTPLTAEQDATLSEVAAELDVSRPAVVAGLLDELARTGVPEHFAASIRAADQRAAAALVTALPGGQRKKKS